jgi:hypothetical protein
MNNCLKWWHWFKPAFAEKDKKQTMTDLRFISHHKDFKTVGRAQELAPKEIAILTNQKISHGRKQK